MISVQTKATDIRMLRPNLKWKCELRDFEAETTIAKYLPSWLRSQLQVNLVVASCAADPADLVDLAMVRSLANCLRL